MPILLDLCNFSVHRNDIALFDPLSLALKAGQACEVKGENGIGKTSLLETLSGLNPFFEGEFHCPTSQLYISRQAPFTPEETLLENLSFWASFWDAPARLSKALQTWHLKHLSHLPYKHLSQGQQQRVNLARLTLKNAPLWLLDEPTTTLDCNSTILFQSCLKEHLQKGGGALIATHHPLNLTQQITLKSPQSVSLTPYPKAVA